MPALSRGSLMAGEPSARPHPLDLPCRGGRRPPRPYVCATPIVGLPQPPAARSSTATACARGTREAITLTDDKTNYDEKTNSTEDVDTSHPLQAGAPVRDGSPTFAELGAHPKIVDALHAAGIERTFAIQELTLPLALAGDDL